MLDADGAAAVENLRAELARAKEQARKSDVTAKKALEELRAEQAARCRSKEEMAQMAEKLKSAADHCELLEKEDRARQTDLEKAVADAKDARSAMRAAKEELRQAEQIAAGKPFMLRRKFCDPKFAPLDGYGVQRTPIWIWQRVLLMRPNTFEIKKIAKWKGFSGRSSRIQSVHWHWTIVWLNGPN